MKPKLTGSQLIIPELTALVPNAGTLSTTRRGGVSLPPYDDGAGGGGLNLGMHVNDHPVSVAMNRQRLRSCLPAEPAWLTQVHGTTVVDAALVQDVSTEADASIATQPGVVCVVQTADCLPVLLCDLKGRAVGAAHAGWRGLLDGVLQETVRRMRVKGADEIVAWLGPAIGPACFEVGQEVADAFIGRQAAAAAAFKPAPGRKDKHFADIYVLARLALAEVGVTGLSGGRRCTVNEGSDFYSYRRDGVTGRMASLIWLN